jgi:1,4-alpha-glucan branching enzyme
VPKKSSEKTRAESKNVSFQLSAPEANTVALAGDFNDWDVNSLPLKKDKRGTGRRALS